MGIKKKKKLNFFKFQAGRNTLTKTAFTIGTSRAARYNATRRYGMTTTSTKSHEQTSFVTFDPQTFLTMILIRRWWLRNRHRHKS